MIFENVSEQKRAERERQIAEAAQESLGAAMVGRLAEVRKLQRSIGVEPVNPSDELLEADRQCRDYRARMIEERLRIERLDRLERERNDAIRSVGSSLGRLSDNYASSRHVAAGLGVGFGTLLGGVLGSNLGGD